MIHSLIVSLLSAILFTSTGTSSDPKVKLLTALTQTEEGESITYRVEYDDQNRIVSYQSEDGTERRNFEYDDDGNPVKIELYNEGDTEKYTVTYNKDGQPVSGVREFESPSSGLNFKEDLQYTVINGIVTAITGKDNTGETKKYSFTYLNGNLTGLKTVAPNGTYNTALTYGTKRSPFYPSVLKYVLTTNLMFEMFSKNEMISVTATLPGMQPQKTVLSYTYDADGYPTVATYKQGGAVVSTTKYAYK